MILNLQDTYFKDGICFGCGPANSKGLRIKSVIDGEVVRCEWRASPEHQAFLGIINGGIIGTLIDCHANWTAAYHLMHQNALTQPPCTVTAEYSVKLLKPTPLDATLQLIARCTSIKVNSASVAVELFADNQLTATGQGVFVAVKPGHPAYHRW